MKKGALLLLLLLSAFIASGNSYAEEPPDDIKTMVAIPTKNRPLISSSLPKPPCEPKQKSNLSVETLFYVVASHECEMPGQESVDYYEAIDTSKKTFFIKMDDVEISEEDAERIESLTDDEKNALRRVSKASAPFLKKAMDNFKYNQGFPERAKKAGLALIKSSIFDTSDYTDGTGYSVEVLNTSKKTIKYITFNVVGYNSVNDPVKSGRGKGASLSLRGVGPIEPDDPASYSWEYAWFTDLVQSHKLKSITVQYMDGSKKVYTDMKSIQVPKSWLKDSDNE